MTRQHAISELQRLSDMTATLRREHPISKVELALTIAIRELRALEKPKRRKK